MGTLQEGKRLFNLKRWDLARNELLEVNSDNLTSAETTELSYYLGLCYTKLEQYEDGLFHLEQVIAAESHAPWVRQCRMTLAYIYVVTNRYKLAEFELGQLLRNGLESAQIYTTLAYAAYGQKNYQGAVELYEKALELDGNNATAINGLGYILVDTDMDLMRGLRFCKKAVELKPQNPAYLDSLGWAYYKLGDAAEARTWLHRAIELAPHSEDIRNHMRVLVGETK